MSAGLRAPRLPLFIAAYSPPRSAPPLASVTIVSNCFNVYVLDCRVLQGKKQKGLKGGNLDMHIHFSYLTWAPQCLRLLGIRDTPGTQPSASVPTFFPLSHSIFSPISLHSLPVGEMPSVFCSRTQAIIQLLLGRDT